MSNMDPRVQEVLKKYHDNPKAAVWNCHGTWVAYHKDLEVVAAKAGITFDPPMVLEANGASKTAALCVTGHMADRSEWSIGEASPANNKNGYPFAMAEKRAKDRVILKLLGLSGFVFSEEEADSFKPEQPAPQQPPQDNSKTVALPQVAVPPKEFWGNKHYTISASGPGEYAAKLIKAAQNAPNIECLEKLQADQGADLNRLRNDSSDLHGKVFSEGFNRRKSEFMKNGEEAA